MSRSIVLRWVALPSAVMGVATLLMAAQNGAPSGEAARMEGFTQADGTNYFALSLRAPPASATTPREVVILFSSAASQVGGYREKSLEAVQSTLASLDPGDRVKIMAYDLHAVPITKDFVAPNGPEVAQAMAALRQRVPLGAADLEGALLAAASSYRGDSKSARAIVLVGEGTSRANALAPEQFEKLVSSLVAERTPVLSYGIGPRIDQPVLWALAGRTGGMAIEDSQHLTAAQVGGMLASSTHAPVYWPTGKAKWPEGTEVYPKALPPLRSDRDTVLVGTVKATSAAKLELGVEGPRGPQTLDWDLPAVPSDSANGYLRPVVEQARIDGGVTLPLVDTASLQQAREDLLVGGRNLDQLARTALAANNVDGAEKLVSEALRRDPRDPEAMALREALAKRRAAAGAVAAAAPGPAANLPPIGAANDLDLVGSGATPGPAGAPPGAPSGSGEGALVTGESQRISAAEQATQMEVSTVINQARAAMGLDPDKALANLRDETEKVRQLPELRPELRDQLLGQMQAAIRAGKARKTEHENHMRQIQEAEAAAKERMLVADSMVRDQQKIRQLMDRFEVLIREGKYKEAEEDAAGEAAKIIDSRMDRINNPQVVDAALFARTKGALDNILAVRIQSQKGFLETLFQVEKSHIPMADEPPIVYPPAEVWKELTARRKEKYSASELSHHGPAEKKIDEALKSPTTIEFVETPLQDVVDYLKDLHKIEIQLDKKELESMNIGADTLVTKNLKGISLRSALKLMLDELQLKYVVHNEVLLITSPTRAESEEFLTTKVYPVADLVIPIQTPTMMGGMGGLGGMMGGMGNTMMGGGLGGMGGGMGGMMGGGMGGMMGGMGGMGMGGMGMGGGMGGMGMGGMFNVPIPPIPGLPKPPRQPDVFNAFFVKEEAVPAETPPASTKTAPAEKKPAAVIDLRLAPGADPAAAWDRYFAEHPKADPADVRRTAKDLMEGRKFDQVVALIEAALRHQLVQSWMYEGLGLALQAAGRPREDVERALMSAADLAQSPADLIYLAAYLERLEMDRRALSLYREVALLDSSWIEPCLHGLRVAKRLRDVDGIQWSAAGILSQAWPVNQAHIFQDAYRAAAATLQDLRAKKRTKEADRFEAAINEALARDCLVVVSWTGEADVDLMVREPAGTVCSLRDWRTTSGGLVQNDVPLDGAAGAQGHTAVYVCPQAFSGSYEAVIRRVWGQVVTGKVTVDLYRHYGTPQQRQEQQKITLERGEALVKFDLADGRRKVPLTEQQVANAAVAQVVLNKQQQILSQQIQMLNDPLAQAQLAQANRLAAAIAAQGSAAGQAGGAPVPFPWPYPVRGAVGYMPVIITLPEGANMSATAVVSADRRYVRITCVPLFSAIAKVTTFSMDTGATSTQQGGGTNGQGFGGLGAGLGGGGLGGGIGAGF